MNNSKNFRSALVAGLALLAVGQAKAQTITRTIDFEYDAYGAVIKQTVEPDDPTLKSVTDFVLHPNYGVTTGKTLSWTDPVTGQPKSRGESVGYDARYRYAESNTNAKGHVTTSTHDAATGNVLTSTDPDQLVTTLAYDPWGRKLRETRPDGTATSTAYRSCVDTCLNGASSVTITQHWGGAGQASQTAVPTEEFTDALGRTVLTRSWGFDGTAILNEKVYDSLGRVLKIARPHYSTQTAVWTFYDQRDALGRLTQSRSPNKTGTGFDTTTYAYNGLTLTTTNAKSQTRSALHNLLGKTKAVTDAYNAVTSYAYDPFGNLVRTTDAKGNQINIGYDKLGRKTTLSDPSLGNWTYVVDALGQTMRQTDAKQQVTDFEFDALGRMTRRLERDLDSRWEYDTAAKGTGDLAEAYTWAGGAKDYRRVHSYDAYGRPNCTVISLDWDYSSCASYDAFGRAQTLSQLRSARGSGTSGAVGNSFTTRYNAQGYANQVDRYDGATSMVWQGQVFDAEGNVLQEQLGNGVVTQRGYNLYTGRLNTVQSGPAANNPVYQNDVYDYDELGNLESRSQLVANSGSLLSETFKYDDLNRLKTSSIGGSLRSTTTYDEIGNLTSKTGVGTYNYPASGAGSVRPSAVSSITGAPAGLTNPGFQYDANGNLVNGLARAYAWTSFNMPASIDKLSGSTPTQRTAFVYSSEHERAMQTISPVTGGTAGNAITEIRYAGDIEKEKDAVANTTTIRTDLPMGLGFIEEKFTGLAISPTATATRSLRYFLKDHLASTLVEMDQAQVVLQRMSYDAWGRRRNADGSDDTGPLWGSLKNTQDHSGYTGHEHLDQLGLVHMNARMYDPLLGRHSSADPTVPDPENGQSFNRYTYVLNNALVFIDPTGLGPTADENWKGIDADYGKAPGSYFASSFVPTATGMPAGSMNSGSQPEAAAATGGSGSSTANSGTSNGFKETLTNILQRVAAALQPTDYSLMSDADLATVPFSNFAANSEKTSRAEARGQTMYSMSGALSGLADATSQAVPIESVGMKMVTAGARMLNAEKIAAEASSIKRGVQAGESGPFGALKGTKGDGLTAHHMPQAAAERTGYNEGGALVMHHGEHVQTRTYGSRGAETLKSDAGLSFRDVLAKDFRDVRSLVGNKYNDGLRKLVEYYEKNFPELMKK